MSDRRKARMRKAFSGGKGTINKEPELFMDEKTGDFFNPRDMLGPIHIKATETTDKKEFMKLQRGKLMKTEGNIWRINASLGKGGYGAVYEVVQKGSESEAFCALKVEPATGERSDLRLKVELRVLTELQEIPAEKRKHFVELIDRGKSKKFKFMVMTLVGPTLHDMMRKYFMPQGFSTSTAMQISLQILTSLQDLHSIGWIHRDIKLTNFCVGLEDKQDTVILLDFGISRRFLDKETRSHKPQRKGRRVVGTARYMPLNGHLGMDQCRKDDLESWAYVAYDVLNDVRGLPWKSFHPVTMFGRICELKRSFMAGIAIRGCDEELLLEKFKQIVVFVGNMQYAEEPDYGHIKSLVVSICEEFQVDLDAKLDWMALHD